MDFLKNKYFSNNKCDEIINKIYQEEILDDNDMDIIENKENHKNYDDFER